MLIIDVKPIFKLIQKNFECNTKVSVKSKIWKSEKSKQSWRLCFANSSKGLFVNCSDRKKGKNGSLIKKVNQGWIWSISQANSSIPPFIFLPHRLPPLPTLLTSQKFNIFLTERMLNYWKFEMVSLFTTSFFTLLPFIRTSFCLCRLPTQKIYS